MDELGIKQKQVNISTISYNQGPEYPWDVCLELFYG